MIIKYLKIIILLSFIHIIMLYGFIFAGSMIEENGKTMYKTDIGEFAKSTWVWIDSDNDNIAECYRFDSDGYLAINYTHYDGKKTNEKGQYISDGKVVRKMLSSNKILTDDSNATIGPENKEDTNRYINKNVIVPNVLPTQNQRKINAGLFVGSERKDDDYAIDNDVIDNTSKKYNPLSDVVAERGVLYSPDAKDNGITVVAEGEKFIPGYDAVKYISASNKFEKDVDEAVIYNGDIWKHCMVLNGNKASVKFLLNKYNYMYFEYSNENHTNDDKVTDAELQIYVDNKLVETIDDFTNGEPQIEELDLDDNKSVEIRLKITGGNLSERVYLRNAKFRKIKDE